ncbi:MAG: TonB-dependent receptor [bacterium]|nr:TonB-dependent receptor [bacterium]
MRRAVSDRRSARRVVGVCLIAFLGSWSALQSAPRDDSVEDYLAELSLEELMELEVTTASKKGESYWRAASAIYVLTGDDIRRSAVTTIPDALRLVPGLQVAQLDSNKWAVTARGFNERFANKLLVLIDGRTVFSPTFSGVYWDIQDTLLEDVDRIEVIRGPGGTLWGANAVNGVINIITKPAARTQGSYVTVGGGGEEQAFVGVRHGGRIGDDANYRIYGKWFDRDAFLGAAGLETYDAWDALRAGFRVDWETGAGDRLSFQGDVYDGSSGTTLVTPQLTPPFATIGAFDSEISGGNLLMRWNRTYSESNGLSLQFFANYAEREDGLINETQWSYDVEFQQNYSVSSRNEMIWGLGYRLTLDEFDEGSIFSVQDDPDNLDLWQAFFQDEMRFADNRVRLVLGTKIEHNTFTGTELQPNLRLAYHPRDKSTLWAAVSRAVGSPARSTRNVTATLGMDPQSGAILQLRPNPDVRAEEVLAFEAGYTVRPGSRWSIDVATFYDRFDELEATDSDTAFPAPGGAPLLIAPISIVNGANARAYGAELATDLRPFDSWRILAGYSYLRIRQELEPEFAGEIPRHNTADNPSHQFFARSSHTLGRNLNLDLILRHVSELEATSNRPAVEAYTELDLRLAWMWSDGLELSVVGRNLLDDEHIELIDTSLDSPPTAVETSVFVRAAWRF